ncbi:MAG: phytanoyl-CoA dioxygenase family protein [Cytophagales bacterium]|nr:phytanoyl-CoA dioxygenase family protein [Armatimonadota bacterium]
MSTTVQEEQTHALESLPALDSAYPLTATQIAEYQQEGFTFLRGVASPEEAAAYRTFITGLTDEYAKGYKPLDQRDTYGKAFIQLSNIWSRDPAVAKFTLARRFARIAAGLMGVDGVRVYHDQALYKEPGGGHTPWHQDQQYWPLDGVPCVTLWMPLVDAAEDMGTMRFAAGSQSLGYLGPQNISDDSEARFQQMIADKGYDVRAVGAMKAGDATFHNGWTLHGAPGNASPSVTREVMTIIYYADNGIISVPDSKQRESDLGRWFPGLKAGDAAASPLNPLVYHKEKLP